MHKNQIVRIWLIGLLFTFSHANLFRVITQFMKGSRGSARAIKTDNLTQLEGKFAAQINKSSERYQAQVEAERAADTRLFNILYGLAVTLDEERFKDPRHAKLFGQCHKK